MTAFVQLVVFQAFGNDLEVYQNEVLLPKAMSRLRYKTVASKILTVNTADESKFKGSKIEVPLPVNFDAPQDFDVVNGTKPTPVIVKSADLVLDKHKFNQVEFSDMQFTGSSPGAIENSWAGMIDSIATAYDRDAASLGKEIPYFSGDLESKNRRDATDLIELQDAIEKMNVYNNRNVLLTGRTNADLLHTYGTHNYREEENSGTLSSKFGFNFYTNNSPTVHKAGTATASAGLKLSAEALKGSKILLIDCAGGETFVYGDLIVIAGTEQSFAVASTVIAAAGVNSVSVTTEVKDNIPGGSALRVVGDHRIDLACIPSFAMAASRRLESPVEQPGVISGFISDPESGLSLMSMMWYDASRRMHQFRLEILYGMKVFDHSRAMRMGGH